MDRKPRGPRSRVHQQRVRVEQLTGTRKWLAQYMGKIGFYTLMIWSETVEGAVVATCDILESHNSDIKTDAGCGGPDGDGERAVLIGPDWCIQVAEMKALARQLSTPGEFYSREGFDKPFKKGGTS